MIDKITPIQCIRQLQFQKYKTAMIPILIIMIGFFLRLSKVEVPYTSIILSLSLVSYLAVLFIYRLGNPRIPESDSVIVAPIHGKILSVEQVNNMVKIRIVKSIFDPVELRCPLYMTGKQQDADITIPYGENQIQLSFGEKSPFLFQEPGTVMGSLLGLVPGSHQVSIIFNESILEQPLKIKKDDVVVAGQTILAELKAPVVISS